MSGNREQDIEYSIHPSVARGQRHLDNTLRDTGRALDDWITLAAEFGPTDEYERQKWLVRTHALSETRAWWIAGCSLGKVADRTYCDFYLRRAPLYVDQMYSGACTSLRPVHDQLMQVAMRLGSDVHVCPCSNVIHIFRQRAIARIRPTSPWDREAHIGVGLSLRKQPFAHWASNPIEKSAGRTHFTHTLFLTSTDGVTAEAERLFAEAYDVPANLVERRDTHFAK